MPPVSSDYMVPRWHSKAYGKVENTLNPRVVASVKQEKSWLNATERMVSSSGR
jgi:hypothetical protein